MKKQLLIFIFFIAIIILALDLKTLDEYTANKNMKYLGYSADKDSLYIFSLSDLYNDISDSSSTALDSAKDLDTLMSDAIYDSIPSYSYLIDSTRVINHTPSYDAVIAPALSN